MKKEKKKSECTYQGEKRKMLYLNDAGKFFHMSTKAWVTSFDFIRWTEKSHFALFTFLFAAFYIQHHVRIGQDPWLVNLAYSRLWKHVFVWSSLLRLYCYTDPCASLHYLCGVNMIHVTGSAVIGIHLPPAVPIIYAAHSAWLEDEHSCREIHFPLFLFTSGQRNTTHMIVFYYHSKSVTRWCHGAPMGLYGHVSQSYRWCVCGESRTMSRVETCLRLDSFIPTQEHNKLLISHLVLELNQVDRIDCYQRILLSLLVLQRNGHSNRWVLQQRIRHV